VGGPNGWNKAMEEMTVWETPQVNGMPTQSQLATIQMMIVEWLNR
jgi:hypothetical protein